MQAFTMHPHHASQWPQQFLPPAHSSSRQQWNSFPSLAHFPPTPPESIVTETHFAPVVPTPSPRTSDSGSPVDAVESNSHGHNHHPYNMMPYFAAAQMQYAPFPDYQGACRLPLPTPSYQSSLYHSAASPQDHHWMFAAHQQSPAHTAGFSSAARPSLASSSRPLALPSSLSSTLSSPAKMAASASCSRRSKLCLCAGCRDPPRRPRPTRRHSCPYVNCAKEYSKTSHLNAHIRWHRGERPYTCVWVGCNKSFTRSDELARHMRSHKGEKKFVCAKCEKRFVRSDHLKKHSKVHDESASAVKAPRAKGSKRAAKAEVVVAAPAAVLSEESSASQPSASPQPQPPMPPMSLQRAQYHRQHFQLPDSISIYSVKENGMHVLE